MADDTATLRVDQRQLGDLLWEKYESVGTANMALLGAAIQATQSAAQHAEDLPDPDLLSDLGTRLYTRFALTSDLNDLNNAIPPLHRALELTLKGDPSRSDRLAQLGAALFVRFKRLGKCEDIEGAVEALREMDELTPVDDLNKATNLHNHAEALFLRFESVGAPVDLSNAISMNQRALDLTPDGESEKPALMRGCGNYQFIRYRRTGELSALERAVMAYRHAVKLVPGVHPLGSQMHTALGNALLARYECTGDPEDLEQAIPAHRRGVDLMMDGQSIIPSELWNNLGNSLFARYRRTGKLDDLKSTISAYRKAIDLAPEGHPEKPKWLNSVGQARLARFQLTSDLKTLEQAISAQRLAVRLTPDGHPDKAWYHNNLGNVLLARFECTAGFEDLETAITAHRLAVELTPDAHPDRPIRYNNLGSSLKLQFERTGEIGTLEQAVAAHRRAVELTPDGHPALPARLSNLSNSLLLRFDRLGHFEDLEGCLACDRRAVSLMADGYIDKAALLVNFGNSLSRRYEWTAELGDLETAIAAYRSSLTLVPEGHADKPLMWGRLCQRLCVRYERLNEDSDIEEAITAGEHAVDLLSKGHPASITIYNDLGNCFLRRFERVGDSNDLSSAITMFEETTRLSPHTHPLVAACYDNLGRARRQLFEQTPNQDHFSAAVDAFMTVIRHPLGNPFSRLKSARHCVAMLTAHPEFGSASLLLSVHSRIVAILPEVIWLGHSVQRRFGEAAELGELVNAAVACAIGAGYLAEAVEWLEAGRALVWSQSLSLRAPVEELKTMHPNLADRLLSVQQRLHQSAHTYVLSDSNVTPDVERHRALAIEYDELLKDIRTRTGFEQFFLPKKLKDLVPIVERIDGPVVFINVHSSRSDALILSEKGVLTSVPLHDLSLERAQQLRLLWLQDLREQRGAELPQGAPHDQDKEAKNQLTDTQPSEQQRGTRFVDDEDGRFVRPLECIWLWIVHPVFDHLTRNASVQHESLPRITWCPTGPLIQLPLHASGIYRDPHGPRAFNLFVSSYIPSLNTLLYGVRRKGMLRPTPTNVLIVMQPETPGCSALPGTRTEGFHLQKTLQKAHINCKVFNHDQATVSTVRTAISHSPWVHLACHGSQDVEDVTQSAFRLYDGPLSLSDLMGTIAENVELAFLSACQTALGDEGNPEESAHLAAGMLAVGFKGVVATLWLIHDADAPVVVDEYYKQLLAIRSEGTLKESQTGAAFALHRAVKVLREKVGEGDFMRWVPFMHFGV